MNNKIYLALTLGIILVLSCSYANADLLKAEGMNKLEKAGKLTYKLLSNTNEVLFVLKAEFPEKESFGGWAQDSMQALDYLREPEQMYCELDYSDGSIDKLIPISKDKNKNGVYRGTSTYSALPSDGKHPVAFTLVSNMNNASFEIISITANTNKPTTIEPRDNIIWYPDVKKVKLSDTSIEFDTSRGLSWKSINSTMLPKDTLIKDSPVFVLTIDGKDIDSSKWNVISTKKTNKLFEAEAEYNQNGLMLKALFKSEKIKINETVLSLSVTNTGSDDVKGILKFPYISNVNIGMNKDNWYFYNRNSAVINNVNANFRDYLGGEHPLQVDGFFNPRTGAGIAIMPTDLGEISRYYNVGKNDSGCYYNLEYLPRTVKPGGKWECVSPHIAVLPGDWKDQMVWYKNWVKNWYKPLSTRKKWFRNVFAFQFDAPPSMPERFINQWNDYKKDYGYSDYLHIFAWADTPKYGHWGDYNHYERVGGKDKFIEDIKEVQAKGVPFGLYLDGYLMTKQSINVTDKQKNDWAVFGEDGKPLDDYDSFVECPYVKEWRDYLTSVFVRLAKEIKPNGLYIDEFGANLVHRTCYNPNHGHPVPMGMSPGETIMLKQIRAVVPNNIATYVEIGASDVMSQYIDGAFSYMTWAAYKPVWMHFMPHPNYNDIAPHYIDLMRFTMPGFKRFEMLITERENKNGNWFLVKYPFFNGNAYYSDRRNSKSADEPSRKFIKNVYRVLHKYSKEFTSDNVEALVKTEYPNLFANRFSAKSDNGYTSVYTLLNGNYRTIRGNLLKLPYSKNTTYFDAWNKKPIKPVLIKNGYAVLNFELGPKDVGCITVSN